MIKLYSPEVRIFLLLITACSICCGIRSQGIPIDEKATRQTLNLYQHLRRTSQSGFLFGHQDDLAYGVGWKYISGYSDVQRTSGSYPGLYGWELGRIELDQTVNLDSVPFDRMRAFIQTGYAQGAAITISWHLNNPLTGKTAWAPSPGTVASILPGGPKNELYKTWLDKVAAFISSLKGTNGESIPVILRLFHELNGNWFWWGGSNCTPDEMKTLWRFTVSYLRDQKQLHNVLYAFNTDRFADAAAYLERYPGDEWVDVMGFDIYQGNNIRQNEAFSLEFNRSLSVLDSLSTARSKIAALTEFGFAQVPDSNWWTGVFLPAMKQHKMAYAMAWRNAGEKKNGSSEFYVPFPGQASEADFKKFRSSGIPLFIEEAAKAKLYQ